MNCYRVQGRRKLDGEVDIQGAKNAVLPIFAATLLNKGETVIHNCPDIEDASVAEKILEELGCTVTKECNTVTVNSKDAYYKKTDKALVKKMRSSVMFAGSILARFGKCILMQPGGCNIGARPIDMHINAFKILGGDIKETEEEYEIVLKKLKCTNLVLPFPSVGVTENVMLLCAGSDCDIYIENAAREPEIEDLANILNTMGAKIYGAGTSRVRIIGNKNLGNAEHTVISDRIVLSTYVFSVVGAGGEAVFNNVRCSNLSKVLETAEKMGADLRQENKRLILKMDSVPKGIKIDADVYPGFPTDAQPFFAAACTVSSGTGVISDKVFPDRFEYIESFLKFGADCTKGGFGARITGTDNLRGAKVYARELRGGAALVVMGLLSSGTTEVFGTEFIKRGYEDIIRDINMLGGKAREVVLPDEKN